MILNVAGKVTANYWLSHVYPAEVGEAHRNGDIHIHDLDMLAAYCAGWSLKNLLHEGFNGVPGKAEAGPAKHLSAAVGQMVNFMGTLQNEWAGAQAFSSVDTYLAPYIRADNLSYEQVDATAGRFGTVVFSTVKGAKIKEVNTHVRNVMARKYQFAPSDDKVFYFNSMEEQVKAFTDLFVMIRKFLWFMGISTLVSGVIGVGNIMYSSAKERTREIGIRKSVGAKAQQIKAMFLWESIALTSLAGYVGLVLGWGILKVVALFISEDTPMMEKPGLDFPTAVAAIFILVIAGTLAGLRPAIYAAELNPIEALKEEN